MSQKPVLQSRLTGVFILVTYLVVLSDVWASFNGINFLVVVIALGPVHLLFALARSGWPRTKLILILLATVLLVAQGVSHFVRDYSSYFEWLATIYMFILLILMLMAGASLYVANDE
ncbi:MAG: hypothetical protein MJK04_00440 [Psychrosphaera sp.]|nr:hypothetical protein [Psychrosphaera sp.]